jgi:hypothetical protein
LGYSVKSTNLPLAIRVSRERPKYAYSATARYFAWRREELKYQGRQGRAATVKDKTGGLAGLYCPPPGEDPTGASTEREGGFDPQLKGRRARGELKGARKVLARHGRTAQPWGGPVARVCAKDPTDGTRHDPAELHVLF